MATMHFEFESECAATSCMTICTSKFFRLISDAFTCHVSWNPRLFTSFYFGISFLCQFQFSLFTEHTPHSHKIKKLRSRYAQNVIPNQKFPFSMRLKVDASLVFAFVTLSWICAYRLRNSFAKIHQNNESKIIRSMIRKWTVQQVSRSNIFMAKKRVEVTMVAYSLALSILFFDKRFFSSHYSFKVRNSFRSRHLKKITPKLNESVVCFVRSHNLP